MSNKKIQSFWESLSDPIVLYIFSYLSATDLSSVSYVCKNWNRISKDNYLWKRLLVSDYKISYSSVSNYAESSYQQKYIHMHYNVPNVQCEVLKKHTSEVLHVSFSHNGKMFASCSKDCLVILWDSRPQAAILSYQNMKAFSWKYTQFSQFNISDSLLLVSGTKFQSLLSEEIGEIAVLKVGENLQLLSRISNRPKDTFGTWYSDQLLVSSNILSRQNTNISNILLWLSRGTQEIENENLSVLNPLFSFSRPYIATVRSLLVLQCPTEGCLAPDTYDKDGNGLIGAYNEKENDSEDEKIQPSYYKLLLFIAGSYSFIPHKIEPFPFVSKIQSSPSFLEKIRQTTLQKDIETVAQTHTEPDYVLNLEGFIIGFATSSDDQPWPSGYKMQDNFPLPPIAQEIQLLEFNLWSTEIVNTRKFIGHRAFTANDNYFTLFLDICDSMIASGAEDHHAYVWDRHFGICLCKLAHDDVVNCVAFNPAEPQMLVTASDDCSLKIWRSQAMINSFRNSEKLKNYL